jgi:hypothetical protein
MVSSNSPTLSRGPILTGKNYDVWSIKMKNFLWSEDCWEAVVNGFQEPDPDGSTSNDKCTEKFPGELRKKDNKSLWLIQQGLEEYIFPKVAATDHAKHAWDTLEIAYQGTDKVKNAKLQTLRKSLRLFK